MEKPDPVKNLLKLEYDALRAEIIQSISYQHQILLAGYGASGAFLGYIALRLLQPNGTEEAKGPDHMATYLCFAALIILPFIFLGMAALWVVECNRMVRASYYIGVKLWPLIQQESIRCEHDDWDEVNWEKWIRTPENLQPPVDSTSLREEKQLASDFRDRQHRSQCKVLIRGPKILSFIAFAAAFIVGCTTDHQVLLCIGTVVALLIALASWRSVGQDIKEISNLGNSPFPSVEKRSVTGAVCTCKLSST